MNLAILLLVFIQFHVKASTVQVAPIFLSPKEKAIEYFNRGVKLDEQMKFDAAVNEYNRAINLDSELFQAYVNKGSSLASLGKFDAALTSVKIGLRHNSNDAIGWGVLARIYYKQKNYEASIRAADKCIWIKLLESCFISKGRGYEAKGDYITSHEVYEVALQSFPDNFDINFNRMLMSFKMFHRVKAEKNFTEFKKKFPQYFRLSFFEAALQELRDLDSTKNDGR